MELKIFQDQLSIELDLIYSLSMFWNGANEILLSRPHMESAYIWELLVMGFGYEKQSIVYTV